MPACQGYYQECLAAGGIPAISLNAAITALRCLFALVLDGAGTRRTIPGGVWRSLLKGR